MATDLAASPGAQQHQQNLWQVPAFFLGLFSVTAVALLRPYLDPGSIGTDRQLATVRAELNSKPAALDQAIARTQLLLDRNDGSPRVRSEAHFVLGSLLLRKAEATPAESQVLYGQAKHNLEQADRIGVPEVDKPALTVKLARAWLAVGTDPKLVIPALTRVTDQVPDAFEAYGLLAEAYRRTQPVDTAGLLEATRQQVARAPANADPAQLAAARLQLAELLIQSNNVKEARLALQRITTDASPAVAATARRLLARCHEEAKEWAMAAQMYEQMRADPKLPDSERPTVFYSLGRTLWAAGQPEAAIKIWQQLAGTKGPEAEAAAFRLVEARLATDPKAAPAALAAAVAPISRVEDYRNTYVPLDEARAIAERAGDQLRAKGEFAAAVELAKAYSKIALPGRAAGIEAQALVALADSEEKQGRPANEARSAAAKGFIAASDAASNGAERAAWLWYASELALKARDYPGALDALSRYVKLEDVAGPERTADAWHAMAQVHQRLGQLSEAKAAYLKCAMSGLPVRFKARYALAQLDLVDARRDAKILKDGKLEENERPQYELRARVKYDDAEKMLQDNLTELRQAVPPDAAIQELTVYGLADIAYEREDYAAAEPRLRGALQEYATSPESTRGRYRLALCVWKRAVDEYRTLSNQRISDDQRQRIQRQYVESLAQAIEQFGLVDRALSAKPLPELTAEERELLVKSGFSVAELQALAGQYVEALASFEALAGRYAVQVEGLHAIHQVWHCLFYYMKQDDKAAEQLARLRDALEKMPDSMFNGITDMHAKQYWIEKIVDMGKKMNK
ncbi:MAG: tetratricopeptide repeat protein [Gemmataceae bacterium]|nr:tetratricopeptide repeat protein [Gemmataceae bacterium]